MMTEIKISETREVSCSYTGLKYFPYECTFVLWWSLHITASQESTDEKENRVFTHTMHVAP